MLKNSSDSIKNYYKDAHLDNNSEILSPLTDEGVETYVHAFFQRSPKYSMGTAPALEWLQFLELFNELNGRYILTEQQLTSIIPYCELNQDVEMTPDDFIRLLYLIRHQQETAPTSSALLDSRPRSSKLMSKKYYDNNSTSRSRYNNSSSRSRYSSNHPDFMSDYNHDDHHSINHPDINNNHSDMIYNDQRSEYNNDYSESDKNDTISKVKRKEKEYESRILNISKEYNKRISELQERLESMTTDAKQQKEQLLEHMQKEKERLDKIAELQLQMNVTEYKNSTTMKQHERKCRELEKVKEDFLGLKETQSITVTKLSDTEKELSNARDMIRLLEKEKSDLMIKLEGEKRSHSTTRQELQEQQAEITKLLEVIDKQKFDLDEARSGLRYYTTSPALNKQSLNINNVDDASLAQEQVEAEYLKKIKVIESEKDEYKQALSQKEKEIQAAEKMLKESVAMNQEQQLSINELSNQFKNQHKLMDSIKSTILVNKNSTATSKISSVISTIALIFFFYHLFILFITTLFFGKSRILIEQPGLYIFRVLYDWITVQ